MSGLDSRERVARCLRHEAPDRVPVDYWAAPEAEARLMAHFGVRDRDRLLDRLGVDFCYIEGPRYVGPAPVQRADGSVEDHFGVPRTITRTGSGSRAGVYRDVVANPLGKARTVDEIDSYPKWPQPDWFDYDGIRDQACRARATGRVVVFMGDRLNRCAQLKPAMYLRGVEQILVDMLAEPELARALFRRIAGFYREYARRTLEAAGSAIDIFFTGDDFGTQQNLFVSPGTWRELLGDGFRQFVELGHAFGCRVAHHTCGCVAPLLPDLAASGLDILNPLQPEVAGMDYGRLKREFGARLTFHGGLSIQKTLPFGSPEEIRREVAQRVRDLAPGGGYILCTAHNLQADVPLANMLALFQAYRDLG